MNISNPINIGLNPNASSFLLTLENINKIVLDSDLNQWSQVVETLNNENIDACVVELVNVPLDNKNKIKIAALFSQNTIRYHLVIKKEKVALGCDMRLADGATIGVPSLYIQSQAKYLNNKINCTLISKEDLFDNKKLESYDAFIVEDEHLHLFSNDKFEVFPIHPTEIWPETGKGIWALVTHQEKIEVFKALRHFHHFEISDIIQPARQLKKWTQEKGIDNIEAYCTKDIQGNYHFHAARFDDNFIRHRISESTHVLLAEKMLNALNF